MASAVPPAHGSNTPAVPGPSSAAAAAPAMDAAATAVPVGSVPDTPSPTAAGAAPAMGLTLRDVNTMRIALVVSRMTSFFKGGCRGDPSHLIHLCYTLARGIDFSVTAGEVYSKAHDLPPIVKQVYKFRNEVSLQPAIMVLLISVKGACKKGWFQDAERDELLAMADEMSDFFCYGSGISDESKALSVISMIMPRFLPQIKLGRVIVSFEAKPGYDVLVTDFSIPWNMPPQEKIRLFVAQMDNMETSSCLISPPHVNFLINGRGVERRTCGYADVGPQFPTDITKMIKYGMNLIQAIGFFGGNYVIAVAVTSTITSAGIPVLQDYAQPVVATLAQDAEIIEGPSKISLNCPISFRRIKTPVKGHHCKHHQCFDYENFMVMNARKPSWRCPHCNQPLSCVDIRIDQNMVKILAETGEDVAHVLISADGSWKVVEDHSSADKPQDGMLTGDRDNSIGCEPDRCSNSVSDVVDLTMEEYSRTDVVEDPKQIESLNNLLNQCGNNSVCDSEERKPFNDVFQDFSVSEFISASQPATFTSEAIQVTHGQVRDDLQARTSSATPSSIATGNVYRQHAQTVGTGLLVQNPPLDPVITDAVSPALNRGDADTFLLPTSAIQSSIQMRQFMDNMQLQQTHLGNSIIANETERQPMPRHVNRTPIAIQALPAQPQIPTYHQRPRSAALSLSSVQSISVQASPSVLVNPGETSAANSGMGRQQFSRIPHPALSSAQLHSGTQSRDLQSSQYPLNPASQHIMGLPAHIPASTRLQPNQHGGGSFSMQPQMGGHSPQLQHPNVWTQQTSQTASIAPLPSRFSIPVQRATLGAVNMVSASPVNLNQGLTTQQSAASARFQATLQASRTVPFPGVGEGTPEALTSNGVGDTAAEQSWRPTGRMRGSLTGSAYAAALNHYMLQSSQSASSRSVLADQGRAVSSEHYSPIPNNTNGNASVTQQPYLRNDDPDGPLRV